MVFSFAVSHPQETRTGTCGEEFWKELLGGREKRSKEQNLKELGF
jgi:hypothetical protein